MDLKNSSSNTELNSSSWPFRKRSEELKGEEEELLKPLFTRSAICTKPTGSELSCFDSFLIMLDNWMDEITNYLVKRETSGFVEGINDRIKVLRR
jgi:transposase